MKTKGETKKNMKIQKNPRGQSDLITMAITAIVVIAIGLALFFIFRTLFKV